MNISIRNDDGVDTNEIVNYIVLYSQKFNISYPNLGYMNEVILAYLAGAIDSDGSISIRRSTYNMRKTKTCVSPIFSPRISLKQTSDIVPKLLKENFRGHIFISKPAKNVKKGKILYCYESENLIAENAVKALLPYLKVKKKQAEIIILLQDIKKSRREGHRGSKQNGRWGEVYVNHSVYSKNQLDRMLGLYLQIRELNDTRYDKLHWPQDLPLPSKIDVDVDNQNSEKENRVTYR